MRLVSYPRSFFCVARRATVKLTPKAQKRLRLVRAWQRMQQGGLSGGKAPTWWASPEPACTACRRR